MKTKTSFYLFSFLVLGMCLMLTESCDKDDEPVPILTTSDVTEITPVSAKCGGHITSNGGATVTERGVCWSTGLTPTIADSKTSEVPGTSTFTSTISGLTAGTTYYVRSYATNANGTGYGAALSFQAFNLSIVMVSIPGGTFTMGSPITEVDRYPNESQHVVTLTPFRMNKFEITNTQFAAFLNAKSIGSDGLYAAGTYPTEALIYTSMYNYDLGLHYALGQWAPVVGYENHPVINVTWYGAAEFATFMGGHLPTEAQWEYACRAGTTTTFNTGICLNNLQANYNWAYPYNTCTNTNMTYPGKTQSVGSYNPNAFGLHDMHGNVWEWCNDWYGAYYIGPQTDPTGSATGLSRVMRGGGWFVGGADGCRSAFRLYGPPDGYSDNRGFRLVSPE